MDAETALKIVTVAAQVAVPITIFVAGRRIARAQYTKSMQDAWNEFNKLAIANESNIRVVREFFGPSPAKESDDSCRKAYLGFVLLNTIFSFYYGARHGLLEKMYQREDLSRILGFLVADDQLYELTQTRGYHPDFKKLCRELRSIRAIEK